MSIACGITTAPRSDADYLPCTVASLRASGFDPLIFAEPGSPVDGDATTVWRQKTLGLAENWRRSLDVLCQLGDDAILLCQDDVVLCRGIAEWLEGAMWPCETTGAVSLYCPSHYANHAGGPIAIRAPDPQNTWGACALLFPRNVAEEIVKHPIITGWTSDRGLDRCVGRVVAEMGLNFWYLTPSLAQHVGEVSSIPDYTGAAAGRRAAGDFIGEAADVRDIWPELSGTPTEPSVFREDALKS